MVNFGTKVKTYLKANGINQLWLSKQIGLTYNNINSFCNGRYNLNHVEIKKLCAVLSLDYKQAMKGNVVKRVRYAPVKKEVQQNLFKV